MARGMESMWSVVQCPEADGTGTRLSLYSEVLCPDKGTQVSTRGELVPCRVRSDALWIMVTWDPFVD